MAEKNFDTARFARLPNGLFQCGSCEVFRADQGEIETHIREEHTSPVELWEAIKAYLKKWIGLRDTRNYDLLTAFVLSSYIQEKFDHAVYLHFWGKKNTGKSRAIKVLQQISCNAFRSIDDTPAGIYRTIEDTYPCTMLLDEFSTYAKDEKKEILRILNSGNESGVTITRINKDAKTPEEKREHFSTFCFKAFAGIQQLSGTLSSRSYKIVTRRISKKYRGRQNQIETEGAALRTQLENWEAKNQNVQPFYSQSLFDNDRVYDLFVPLLTVAPSEDIRETLIQLGEEMVQAEDEDENETADALVLEAIQEIVTERSLLDGARIPISDIQAKLGVEAVYDIRKVGRIAKRLGFQKQRSNKQKQIVVSSNLVECRSAISAVSSERSKQGDQAQNPRSKELDITAQTAQRHDSSKDEIDAGFPLLRREQQEQAGDVSND